MYSDDEASFFREHGIDLDIAASRPYERWRVEGEIGATRLLPASRELLTERYHGLETGRTIVAWANQTDGWIINRHGFPASPQVFPEIRGDRPIRTSPPTRHFHGERDWHEVAELCAWPAWRRHKYIRSEAWAEVSGHLGRSKYLDDHRGSASDEVHEHSNIAKYTFPPSPKRWREGIVHHDHADYQRGDFRRKHVAQRHDGRDVDGKHESYRFKFREPTMDVAKRIDIHPLALLRFPLARVVFFALEGCIKSDSILSYVRRHNLPATVFSVPSVTLWDTPELDQVVDGYLVKSQPAVIIVVDSDWAEISAVRTQARLCRTRLWRRGLETVRIAAPPADSAEKKVGVDDHLVAGFGLEDLELLLRTPNPKLQRIVTDHLPEGKRERAYWALNGISMHADGDGRFEPSVSKLIAVTGWPRNGVYRGKDDVERAGLITVTGKFAFRLNRYRQPEWAEQGPVITLDESVRALPEFRRRLGDVEWFQGEINGGELLPTLDIQNGLNGHEALTIDTEEAKAQ